MAKWAYMRRYNPDSEWASYTYKVYFYGNDATVHIALNKINMWDDDVAAYAFIREVCFGGDGIAHCAFSEGDGETIRPTGTFKGIDYVAMELQLYGPILAEATLLGVYL